MKPHRLILSFFFLFVSLLSSPWVHAKVGEINLNKEMKEEGPIDIEADELAFEKETQLYEAYGQVEVSRGSFSLKADHVQFNMATKELVAWGNVLLREGEDVLECSRLEVNVETQLGKIYQARLFLKDQNFHITGGEVEKLGENHYRIRRGSLTTCDAKRPPWKFGVKELEVKEMALGGWGVAKGALFYLEEVPLLYLPWGVFPVRTERQTGFLLPSVGYSNKHGPEIKSGFYWAFAKNMDATFYLDYLGDRGFKEGLEYRYAFPRDTKGQANVYFIHDQDVNKNRYAFFIEHQQKFPYEIYLKADINRVSDHKYFQDFTDDHLPEAAKRAQIDMWSLRQLRSVLFGGKNWDQFSFISQGALYDDFTKESNDETIQKLPQISFYAHPQSLFKTPLYYELSSSYTYFWRDKGVHAHRGDFFPKVFFPTRLFDVFKFESEIGVRETYYHPSYHRTHYNNITIPNQWTGAPEPVDSTDRHPELQYRKSKSREILEAGAQISTEFYRVYDGKILSPISQLFKVSKWMHTIEPSIRYRYSPRVDQEDLPLFDEIDRIPYTNEVSYGITQRLIGKPEKEGVSSGPFEYAKLILSQNYSFGDPYDPNRRDPFGNPYLFILGEKRSFSSIRGELWWNFSPYISAHWDAELNPNRWKIERFNFNIKAKDRRDDVIQVQYRNTKMSLREIVLDPRATAPPTTYLYGDTNGTVHQVNLDARVKTIPPLYLFGSFYYNLREGTWIQGVVGAEYQSQCWSAGFVFEERNRSPDRTQSREYKFRLYVNLLNIGSFGRKPYLMNL